MTSRGLGSVSKKSVSAGSRARRWRAMRRGDGDSTSARHTNHLALIKTSESRISPASHRGRKIVARCAGGDPLWQDVAQGGVRYERFWALLATVGGEAVGGRRAAFWRSHGAQNRR